MSKKSNVTVHRVAAILGLDCGVAVYELLSRMADVELVAVFCRRPETANGIAGYVDLGPLVTDHTFHYYDSLGDVHETLSERGNEIATLDLIVAIGISDIVKEPLLSFARLGCLGAHAAPLPARPGAAPIVWAILDGLQETAMTIFAMQAKVDTGPVFGSKRVPIDPDETGGTLRKKMDVALVELLEAELPQILSGRNRGIVQEAVNVHYTRRRGARDGEFSPTEPADAILRKVRALSAPYPGAHFYSGDGVPIIVESARRGPNTLEYDRGNRAFTGRHQRAICVVAHPDDEALGLAGTLIKHAEAGHDVGVVILSEGEAAKVNAPKSVRRREAAREFAGQVGIRFHRFYDFPDQALDTVPLIDIIQRLEKDIADFCPTVVYLHHPGDMNSDHQIAAQSVMAALRPMSTRFPYPELLTFETPSSTDQAPNVARYAFLPNHYVQVDDVWDRKLAALNCYRDEIGKAPHPRSLESIDALARVRGAEIGVGRAEAFAMIRRRWD